MNEELIRNTIQKMRDAGISDTIIASTLTDLGLNSSQIQAYLSARRGSSFLTSSSSETQHSYSSNDDMGDLDREALASRTSEKVVQRLDERDRYHVESDDLKDNITHLALEQHGQQLKDTHEAVVELHNKFDATNLDTLSNRVTQLNAKMDMLSKNTTETKALLLAVQSLMQKILEANQEMMYEMKKRE